MRHISLKKASIPVAGMLVAALAIGTTASAATKGATHSTRPAVMTAQMRAAATSALEKMFVPGRATARPPAGAATSQTYSYNWSGYADVDSAGNTYQAVSASFTEPAVTCTREQELAAFWVGLDGWTDGTVEQDGTLAYCYEGYAYYATWWEMYPSNDIQVVGELVAPGDQISSSVSVVSDHYNLTVIDSTNPDNSFTVKEKCGAKCEDSSAEWIAEAPSGSRGEYPLPKYTPWRVTNAYTSASATTGSISAFPNYNIGMVDDSDSYLLSEASNLNSSGTGFTAKWLDSY
jgi:hypothetical protein